MIPWERFCSTVAEAEALARPEEFDAYQSLGEHYAGIRRWSPAFLEAFEFESVPASASLMRAIEVLREMNRTGKSRPAEIRPDRVRPAALGAVRHAGRRHRPALLRTLRAVGAARPVARRRRVGYRQPAIPLFRGTADFQGDLCGTCRKPARCRSRSRRISSASSRAAAMLLDKRLAAVDARAKDGLLPDVTIDKGVLKITPIEKSTPPEAEALAARLYAMLPRIRITDLLAEVAGWTLFPDCFTHLRTGAAAIDSRILMAGLLADGLNLGLTRMAEACSIASLGQLAWTSDWHIREETYALGVAASGQPAAARAVCGHVRQRRRLVVRRSVLPGRLASAATPAASTPITARSRVQGLHAPLGPLRALLHQADCGDGERGAARAGRAALSPERRFRAPPPHGRRRRFRPCLRALHPAGLPVRAAHSGPEAPSPLQLRQTVRLSDPRTPDRRTHQCRPDPRAIGRISCGSSRPSAAAP